ncbi:RNA polymerase sigma factor [Sphingobacterium sp. BN32]|uniref:RNA polymerase sigma factor n=1 Tax=Sphingobacterium sp. BN32 TaxID=3058432 RepID=UPI00265D4F35|nr:sigma-70 family RNA polymerase sigma factor [Sphingobacterium sp. BN32]WKK58947.1 sigma-70 family RNA polymerase sigma factor [Sphingobacterium sp. BN32]
MSKIRKILPKSREDAEIVEGMRNGDNDAISYIYKSFYPSISHLIVNNNGTEEEAQDIFQEGVMVLYDKVTHDDFALSSKLSTFLYAICRRLWLKSLSKKGNSFSITDHENFEIPDVEDDLQQHMELETKFDKMEYALESLGEPCSTILREFYIKNKSMQYICDKLGYTNADNAKNQKYKCLQRLKKLFFDQK